VNISVLVLTKNEEVDLPGCLDTLRWSDDIIVLDSRSSDSTADIARRYGATVVERAFDNWSSHQNWALRSLPFKHEWVYYSDADERLTPELIDAIKSAVSDPGDNVAFRIRRRDYLMGKWLRHVTPSPFNIRLFKPGAIRYERLTNPVTIVDGPIGEIHEHFDHFPFSKGISHWIDKHNRYSSQEAGQIIANSGVNSTFSIANAFFSSDPNERRFHQKELYYRLPLRPLLMFLLLYVGKRGFLDGRAGLTFAVLRSIYEYFIVLKTRELQASDSREP
jgi:glycosyltransferase involved in cell wall biosynthesis